MIDEFLIRALLAGIGVALAAGPLGAFVIWRRMAYFGDATAHGAILGVALALGLGLPIFLGTLGAALAIGATVAALAARGQAMDTALGVLAHGALAVGLLAFGLWGGRGVNLESFLFGDILLVNWQDVAVIWGGAACTVALLVWRWQALLITTLNEELAQSAGINPGRERLVLTLALALVVAVALKVVGALLIGAMLIIPAAGARGLVKSPEGMAVLAVLIGVLSVVGGLVLSFTADTMAGPSIVCVALVFFVVSLFRR